MRSERLRPVVFALIAILIGAYYLWAVRATGEKFEWGYDLSGYYDLLGRALAHGHFYLPIEPSPQLLAQPNPWDPAVDPSIKWHDMVLYGGHYYLYFGAAPAVLVFTPWRLLTGHDLPENFGIFVLCFGGFLFSCGALLRVLDLTDAKPGPLLLALLFLALGICQSIPYLLNRVAVYEIAIAGGYFCLSGAVFFLARGIRAGARAPWLAASGLMFGFAVASRPHLVLAGVITLVALLLFRARSRGIARTLRSREFVAFTASLALVGIAIAVYNYARFGNPLEFGFRYQLAGPGQNRIELGLRNLFPGLYFMLLSRPEFSPVFPWMRMVFRFPFDSAVRHPLPPEYFVEPTVGALWLAPFVVAVLLLPFARKLPGEARVILSISAVSSVAVLLFLMLTHLATHRYEVDFVPLGVFAALVVLAIFALQTSGFWRIALNLILPVLIVYSAIANLALGIAGPYDDLLKNRPTSYVRIARWFSPIRQFRPVIDPEINVELETSFIPEPPALREPMVTIGHSHFNAFLYVEHPPGAVRFVLQTEDSRLVHEMPDPGSMPIRIRLEYSPKPHLLTTSVNGQQVITQPVRMLITAPAEVAIGENFSDLGLTARRAEARIRVIEKSVR